MGMIHNRKELHESIIKKTSNKLHFVTGKYQGRLVSEIIKSNPNYCFKVMIFSSGGVCARQIIRHFLTVKPEPIVEPIVETEPELEIVNSNKPIVTVKKSKKIIKEQP